MGGWCGWVGACLDVSTATHPAVGASGQVADTASPAVPGPAPKSRTCLGAQAEGIPDAASRSTRRRAE